MADGTVGAEEASSGGALAEGRLGNVSAALLLGGEPPAAERVIAQAAQLARLCHDVVLSGPEPPGAAPGRRVAPAAGAGGPLPALVAALEACRAERVLVTVASEAGVPSDLLLALTAFPDEPAVVPRDDAGPCPGCAIYHRGAALDAARERLAAGDAGWRAWLEALGPRWLEGDALAQLLDGQPLPAALR